MLRTLISRSCLTGILCVGLAAATRAQDGAKPAGAGKAPEPAKAQEAGKTDVKTAPQTGAPRVELEIESGGQSWGKIVLELDDAKAPISVNNFLQYVTDGYYDGLIFHRIIPTFMIQAGGYNADLKEKGGTRPPIKNEWQNGLKNNRGTISMARQGGNVDSATAQFFINVVDNRGLDAPQPDGAGYAVFGKVVEGMDVADKIKSVETKNDPKLPMGKVVPTTPILIKSAKLIGNYDRAKLATKAAEAEKAAKAGQK